MTNADHESMRALYTSFGQHTQLARHGVIAGDSSYRSQSTELLITK